MQDIKIISNLLLRNLHILGLCFVAGIGIAALKVYKAQTLYQASATLMLNDKESGVSGFLKNFEQFSATGKLLTEVEVLKSRYLIGKAIEKLDVQVPIRKSIRGEWRDLYQRSPFNVEIDMLDKEFKDKVFYLNIRPDSSISIQVDSLIIEARINEQVNNSGFSLCVVPNLSYLNEDPTAFSAGKFQFEFINRERLIDHYSGDKLTVKLLDKEVSIIKIYFRHTSPLKAQHFVNALLESYLESFIQNKTEAANKALAFINNELSGVTSGLQTAEQRIAAFKQAEGITELNLDADDRLKKLRERDLQYTQLSMELAELQRLSKAITKQRGDRIPASQLGVVSNANCQLALERLQALEQKGMEKLQVFTKKHPEVQIVNQEIALARKALMETLESTLSSHLAKMRELEEAISGIEKKLRAYPLAEQRLLGFERDYASKQKQYDFLLDKKIEAGIGAASQINFHKILERASTPRKPVGMGRKVMLVIGAMVGFCLGLMLLLAMYYVRGPVLLQAEAEEGLGLPLMATIKESSTDIATQFLSVKPGTIHSVIAHEKKVPVAKAAYKLAEGLNKLGKSSLCINLVQQGAELSLGELSKIERPFQSKAFAHLGATTEEAMRLLYQPETSLQLEALASSYDFIFLLCPPLSAGKLSIAAIEKSSGIIALVRKGKSKKSGLKALKKQLDFYVNQSKNLLWIG